MHLLEQMKKHQIENDARANENKHFDKLLINQAKNEIAEDLLKA